MARQEWFRDHYFCEKCGSLPRQRALILVLDEIPELARPEIHEASPSGPASDRLARECPKYRASYCYPGVGRGRCTKGFAARTWRN